jgi:predicted O-methyltransferase YrrM
MARKALQRITDRGDRAAATAWAEERAEGLAEFCLSIDGAIWEESTEFASRFQQTAAAKLAALDVDLGGGGAYPLMYFLTRWLKPSVVIETGVAAGWTSVAILAGLEANGSGELYSSDFPYFRLDSPEKYVGYLVPEDVKHRWHLSVEGDRKSVPVFVRTVDRIDLVHYDSDKTADGRRFAMNCLADKLSPDAVIVMDDIQDDIFFRDWVTANEQEAHTFRFEGKYLGLVRLRARTEPSPGPV